MKTDSGDIHVNVGSGDDLSIRELAEMVGEVVGFEGDIVCDATTPDGTPRKLTSANRIRALGWAPRIKLRDGIAATYGWFLAQGDEAAR